MLPLWPLKLSKILRSVVKEKTVSKYLCNKTMSYELEKCGYVSIYLCSI